MNPILYPSTETAFDTNGLGVLSDALACTVTEERNGIYELELQYPLDGLHYGDIALRCLILAKPNPTDDAQPFRVYRISRPMNGIVTVYAQHLRYDLNGIAAQPFTAPNAPAALAALKANAVTDCPFTFWTDKTTVAAMTSAVPVAIGSLLGGKQGSVLDVYGGEFAFDRYTVRLYAARGANRGVSIRYGKNLTSLEQDENCASVYTGVYPYWANTDGILVQLPEKLVAAPGTYSFTRILPLDLSSEWQEAPTEAQLRARAQQYIQEHNIGVPKVSLTVSFAQLEQTEEYKDLALLERVSLCDAVNVEFPALGVSATAKVVKTVYDSLRGRWESVDLGDARTTLADTIAGQGKQIAKAQQQTTSFLQKAIDSATQQITGNKGGYVVLHSSTGGDKPDEILIMDKPKIADAVKVWRWNKAGLGYSSTGYNGPYGLAMTQDGSIVASFINTGTLNAALIHVINLTAESIVSGILSSQDGTSKFDLNNGVFSVQAQNENGIPQRIELVSGKLSMQLNGKNVVQIKSNDSTYGGSVAVGYNGQDCAAIDGKENGGRFILMNPEQTGNYGRWVAGINTNSGQPYMTFTDQNQNARIRIQIKPNGSPLLSLYNANSEPIWQVYEDASGNAVVYQKTS